MKASRLEAAITEAERFLSRARELHDDRGARMSFNKDEFWGGKQTGAVRRASLDLSRALADLRRKT